MVIDFDKKPKQKIWEGIIGGIQHSDSVTIAHLSIKAGTVLPEHFHHNEQWSNVLEGEFEFTLDGEQKKLTQGMTIYIAPNAAHSGRALTDCKIIDVFHPPRHDWKNLEKV